MRPLTPRRILAICGMLAAILFVVVVISLRVGAYPISMRDIVVTLYNGAVGNGDASEFSQVIFGLRLPRIALGILVGASLSTSGAGFQALLRNPLADPYVLGVSSGAALGAMLSLIIAPHTVGAIQVAAFIGAAATIAAVYFLGRRGGQLDSATLLLAGIVGAVFPFAVLFFSADAGKWPRAAQHDVLADGRSDRASANAECGGLVRFSVFCLRGGGGRDVHHVVRSESDSHRRAGSRAPGRERDAREAGGVCGGIGAHGPGRFGERHDRICGPAGAARDAHAFRHGLPAAGPHVCDRRRDCDRAGGYAGADDRCADGIAGGRDDGASRRTGIYLPDAQENSVNAGPENGASVARQPVPFAPPNRVRLKVEQASYAYSATDRSAPKFTLGPVSFEAQQRELVAILGPNASGKSTLLKLLAGLIKPLSGRVEVDGTEVSELELRTRAQQIALVSQESELLFPLRVWEYVLQGRYPYGKRLRFESDEDCLMAGNALAQVGADALRDRWMGELSGGEKQRVILARALAQQPSLLLLDEPTQHLDIGGKVELLRRLRRLADENRYTVVVVTHELNLAAEFSDRIALLHKGKCLRIGDPAEVYQRDVLEEVFEAPLEVEMRPSGRPRVLLRGSH